MVMRRSIKSPKISAKTGEFNEEILAISAGMGTGHRIDYAGRFKYPGLALGLSLAVGPMELAAGSVLVGIVVARASLPTLKRTLSNIQTTGRPSVDLLDTLWILFHTVTGELLAPALAICLTEAGNTLRDLTAMAGQRQMPELVPNRQLECRPHGQVLVRPSDPGIRRAHLEHGTLKRGQGRLIFASIIQLK